jgi:serine/threonine protein kinase
MFSSLFSTVHRDLKPANVLVNGDKLCIADLGQARVNEIVRDTISLSSM